MLRVMTLNVGSLLEPHWDERRHEVVAQIAHAAADIVCLQEVWQDSPGSGTWQWVVAELEAEHQLRYEAIFGGHPFEAIGDRGPGFEFGSAILSRWPIEESQTWRLPVAEDPRDPIPAMVPWELVHARTAELDIFTTHLAPAPTHGRHRRLQVLDIDTKITHTRAELDEHQFGGAERAAMPAILTGDFNAEPQSDEIRFLKGLTTFDGRTTFFQDAWEVSGNTGPGFTNDWRTHPLAGSLNVHRKRIDYILVGDPFRRAGDAGRVLDCRIVANEPITGVQASDHAGLVADIVWPSRPD